MKTNTFYLNYFFVITLSFLFSITKAQNTKAVNVLLPMDLVDKRSGPISKTIGGMDAMVNITVNCGIKYLDGCSDENTGTYKGEFNCTMLIMKLVNLCYKCLNN